MNFVGLCFVILLQCAVQKKQKNKMIMSIGLGLYLTVFKSEVPCRSSLGTSCILKKIRTDSLKVPVPLPINTTSSNLQRVCFEMGLVPVLSLEWIRLTNRSCYCLVQCCFLSHNTLCRVSACVSVVKPVTV